MGEEQSRTVRELLNGMEGVSIKKKHGSSLKFKMYLTQTMSDASIEALDLSVRSYNSLKRAGFDSVGELAEAIASGMELKTIRNCGIKSVREIMEHLFLFQYNSMSVERQEEYLREVVRLNARLAQGH